MRREEGRGGKRGEEGRGERREEGRGGKRGEEGRGERREGGEVGRWGGGRVERSGMGGWGDITLLVILYVTMDSFG